VLALTWLCYVGIRESSGANHAMVILKVALIVIVIAAGWSYVNPDYWHPFIPRTRDRKNSAGPGSSAARRSCSSPTSASRRRRPPRRKRDNPQRDLPIGTIASLAICTVLYIGMADRADRSAAVRPARHERARRHRGAGASGARTGCAGSSSSAR
jgi:APA family basic amino acid/polyamine antiporter